MSGIQEWLEAVTEVHTNYAPNVNIELESKLKRASADIGWCLIFVSLIILCGRMAGIDWLQPPFLGIVSMKVTAAIAFLLAGTSLVLRQSARVQLRFLGLFCALLVILLGLGILALYIGGIDLEALYPFFYPLVSPLVSSLFVIGGLGLVLAPRGNQDLPAIVIFTTGSLAFFTRVFGIRVFHERYGVGYSGEMGTDTYLSFLACGVLVAFGIGILFANPQRSLKGLLCSTTRGGYITRRFLPLAVAMPMFWAAVTTAGEFAHLYNLSIRWTLFVNGTILSFCLWTCYIAKRLDQIDQSRIILAEKRADVVYSLAHDLKVPIIGATQSLDLLLKEALGELKSQQRSLLSVLRDSMSDQLWMIENLVYEYKTEQGKETIAMTPCAIDKLLDDCVEKIRSALQAKHLEVEIKHESPNVFLLADPVAIRRVINNLLHNALKHCPRSGRMQITSRTENDKFSFTIWNSGPTISDAQKQHLFERFWQSEETHSRHIGNGLGLYICRQIIEAHGGDISCHSEQGEGTAFKVDLPIAEPSK